MLLKYTIYLISRLWSGRHFPESRHIVDSTLFHIALCASQFRVWNRYHIMTPLYVSVIYFLIRSLVRHLPNTAEHFNRVFSTCAVRKTSYSGVKTKTLGTEWMFVVDWLIFRHGVFPALKSIRVENAPYDVVREILLNIIHTRQIKIRQKKLKNLFTPSAIFFVTKFHVFVIMSKATSEIFSSYQRNRTVLSFRERYRLTVLYQPNCVYDGTNRGFTKCDLIVTKSTKLFFSLSEQ